MKTLIKYLKPYIGLILLSIILLFGQAISNLSLPNYMSDIVNVGIQQAGIDDPSPKVISKNGMDLLSFFMRENDREFFTGNYTLILPDSQEAEEYLELYPLLETDAIYVQKDGMNYDDVASDETIYNWAVYAFINYMQDVAGAGNAQSSYDSSMNAIDVDTSQLYQFIPYLSMQPSDTFTEYIDLAKSTDPSFTKQVGIAFTGVFYKEAGVDVAALRNNYIVNTGLIMLLITFLGAGASITVGFLAARVAAGASKTMRRDVFEKVENFSSHEFDQFSTASLITRTTNDITQVQMMITMSIRMLASAPIMGIGGIIMALNKSVSLSWIIAVAVLVLIGVLSVIFSIALPKFKLVQTLVDKLNLVTRENLSGLMVIRAFGNQEHEEARFDVANQDLTKTNLFINRVMVFMMPFMMFLMNAMTLLIVWIGGHQIAASTMQVGDMMAFMQYAMQIIFAFLMIAMMFIFLPRALVSASRIGEVLDTPLTVQDPDDAKTFGQDVKGEIKFNDVSFRYANAESDVLHNINFTAKAAQTTAIIGSTGSGKSTLINLIPRFYDVTKGSITIDGVDVREVTQHDLHDIIGYVPQKGVLFSGNIESNITYGKEDATEADVKLAAKIAQAEEFIDTSEEQYQTPIAQGGANVSGGQKQRLAIARALIKKTPIYIFDDSFFRARF